MALTRFSVPPHLKPLIPRQELVTVEPIKKSNGYCFCRASGLRGDGPVTTLTPELEELHVRFGADAASQHELQRVQNSNILNSSEQPVSAINRPQLN